MLSPNGGFGAQLKHGRPICVPDTAIKLEISGGAPASVSPSTHAIGCAVAVSEEGALASTADQAAATTLSSVDCPNAELANTNARPAATVSKVFFMDLGLHPDITIHDLMRYFWFQP
jgi:hypothetical protein